MKIIHLSTSDAKGGAPRAAWRIHEGVRRTGIDSTMWVADKSTEDAGVELQRISHGWRDLWQRRRNHLLRRRRQQARAVPDGLEAFTDDEATGSGEVVRRLMGRCDIVHVHWTCGFIGWCDLFQAIRPPQCVVVTLHDAWPLLGGCHYPGDEERLTGDLRRESEALRQKKKSALLNCPAPKIIIALSHWMEQLARRSFPEMSSRVKWVPSGLDTNIFSPKDKWASREILGWPQDRFVVLFVADVLGKARKGMDVLQEARRRMPGNNWSFVAVGAGGVELSPGMQAMAPVWDDRLLAILYSAADVFVLPSREENFSQTALEALACGTPVVGSAVGGTPDIVRDMETGLLFGNEDAQGLADCLMRLDGDRELRKRLGQNGREMVLAEYSLEVTARPMTEIYRSLQS